MPSRRKQRKQRKQKLKEARRLQLPTPLPPEPPKTEKGWWHRIPKRIYALLVFVSLVGGVFIFFPTLDISVQDTDPSDPLRANFYITNNGFITASSLVVTCRPEYETAEGGSLGYKYPDIGFVYNLPAWSVSYRGKVSTPCHKTIRINKPVTLTRLKMGIIVRFHIWRTPFFWTTEQQFHAEQRANGEWVWYFDNPR
jgi:hypothetical protein